jgi:hypothetical protein
MLGLEGMAVLAVSQRDGEVEYAIETTAATGWCQSAERGRGCMIAGRHGCGICPPGTGR